MSIYASLCHITPVYVILCQFMSYYVSLCQFIPVCFTSCHLYQLMSADVSLSVCYFLSVCQFLLHSSTTTNTVAFPPSLCLSQDAVHPVRPISNSRTSRFVLSLLLYHDCYVGATGLQHILCFGVPDDNKEHKYLNTFQLVKL